MSRDQKPGRSNRVARAPAPVTDITASSSPVANPAPQAAQGKPPVVLLASLFVVASIVGGVGFALSEWLLQ